MVQTVKESEKEKVNLASTSVSLQVAALAMMDKVIHDSKTEKKTKEDNNLS